MAARDVHSWMAAGRERVEAALDACLPAANIAPTRLHEAMRYAVLGGGKRVRALLCFAAGEFAGADPERLLAPACALELVHAYSLVHDDLPCMDDDVLRRGKPTVHVEFDEATAVLVGDALQSLAFCVLAGSGLPDAAAMVADLARAAGSRGMAGGQMLDLLAADRDIGLAELENLHIHKTGALIRVAVVLGARSGSVDAGALARLDRYGMRIGLLFQVVDDLLDALEDTATLGKTAGKDAAQNKATYVSRLGVETARAYAHELLAGALEPIAGLGDAAEPLRALARFVAERQF
ncbi:MAG: Farnesyl diphosphate synthase [Rhodocyclaceae bacterium]|jgi:farnesyl diphosphate synthase|nr:Farnesyl diphosphate synthase [Rhodocyclaceae bacterium]